MRIAIIRTDGGVSIMHLSEEVHVTEQVDEQVAKWETSGFTAVSWRLIAEADIPEDRTFRGALTDTGSAIVHHMPTCREIWRDKMRSARKPLLASLDVEFQRGLENAADLKPIAVAKQALRDVTADPTIEAAKTPDELKRVWPALLGPRQLSQPSGQFGELKRVWPAPPRAETVEVAQTPEDLKKVWPEVLGKKA